MLSPSPGVRGAAVEYTVTSLWAAGRRDAASRRSASPAERGAPVSGPIPGPSGRLYVDDGGQGGVPVLFLHSFAGDVDQWRAQLAHLRPARRAIAIDLRGHGKSDPPKTGGYAVDAQSRDVAAVVDRLGLDRVVLVGHSMGGVTAIDYAGRHPDRVAGLMMVGAPGRSDPDQAAKIVASMRADYDTVAGAYWDKLLTNARPQTAATVRGQIDAVPRDASLAIIEAIFAYDPTPALRGYPGPKQIVDTAPGETPGSLHALAPEIPREVMTGTSHWPHMDDPEAFNRILDAFLARVETHTPMSAR